MIPHNVQTMNLDLAQKRKAIVAVGCSYTYGRGAYDQELLDDCLPKQETGCFGLWDYAGHSCHDPDLLESLAEKYKLVYDKDTNTLQTWIMELNNSFPAQLGTLLNDEWSIINLGAPGRGNIAAVDRLFLYNIDWHLADEIIVLFMPTGYFRIDVIANEFADYNHISNDYETLHLLNPSVTTTGWQADEDYLIQGLTKHVLTKDIYQYKALVRAFKFIDTWCKMTNADLTIIPALDKNPTIDEVFNSVLDPLAEQQNKDFLYNYLKSLPFDRVAQLDGHDSLLDLMLNLEGITTELSKTLIDPKKGGKWITPCGHPTANGHYKIAVLIKELLQHNGVL